MLRAKADHLTPTRRGFQRELHHQTLLRPERPVRTILRDLGIAPAVMPLGLRQLDLSNALGGVILAQGRNGMLEQSANSLQPRPFCARACDLSEHFSNVFTAQ